ncbi:hypothetical protein GCM10028827_14770 [Mucilaginibacter myungsuensis]
MFLGMIFLFIVIKFAMNGGNSFSATGLPTNEDAYSVSQDMIRSTVRSPNVDFPADGFQIGKKSDSIYIVRTAAELEDDGGTKKSVSFKVLMEYKGGKQNEMKNWSLLNISEEQH